MAHTLLPPLNMLRPSRGAASKQPEQGNPSWEGHPHIAHSNAGFQQSADRTSTIVASCMTMKTWKVDADLCVVYGRTLKLSSAQV